MAQFRSYDDGHNSLSFRNIQLDFSNNFVLPGIGQELAKKGIDNPTPLQEEVFSRDFTVNTLLQPMDLSKEPLDPTGMGKADLEARLLRTPADPELTIGHDARRILRAIKLSLQFGLEISEELGKAMEKYRGALVEIPLAHVRKQVNQMLRIDAKKAISMLAKYGLLPIIPLSRLMSMEIAKHRMTQHLLDGGLS